MAENTEVTPETLARWEKEAAAGAEEAHLSLGRHWLAQVELGVAKDEEMAPKAVGWLVEAAKQGNEEATELLKKCLETRTGITPENEDEVNWCVSTSVTERRVRHGARMLFKKINPHQQQAVSVEEYKQAIRRMVGHEKQQKLLLAAGRKIGQEISENEFVKLLSKKVSGSITLTSDEMEDASAAYKSASWPEKITKYPRETAALALDKALEVTSKEGMNWVVSLVPTHQVSLLATVFVYSCLTPSLLLFIIPLIVFYLAFATLLITSLQMFYRRRKQSEAANLAQLLKECDIGIDIDQTQSQYSWNSLTPYLVFFCTLPLAVASYSLANKAYIPCSEVFVVSMVMAVLCFIGLGDRHDKLTLLALLCNFIASLPVFLQGVPRLPVLGLVVDFLTAPLLSVDLGLGFRLNLSLPALAYLTIPVFFVVMAVRGSFTGTYLVLIPHLVCYFWWNFMTASYPFTSWTGLLRSTLGYLLLPFLLPLSFVGVIILFGFAFFKLFQTEMLGKMVITLVLLAIPLLLTQTKVFLGSAKEARFATVKKVLMGVFAVLAVVPLLFIRFPSLQSSPDHRLSWETYHRHCWPQDPSQSLAHLQIGCSELAGIKVRWSGTVQAVKLAKLENTAESFIRSLPTFLSGPLSCIYGKPLSSECSKFGQHFCEEQLHQALDWSCTLRHHDVYTFQIMVAMSNQQGVVSLEAAHRFKATVLTLQPGDQVAFNASLSGGLGTSLPSLKLAGLASHRQVPDASTSDEEEEFFQALQEAAAVTVNFILFPVVEFRS